MPFEFTRHCAGDLGIRTLPSDTIVAMVFYRASGGYPVFDVMAGGPPIMHDDLAGALNTMVAIAQGKRS